MSTVKLYVVATQAAKYEAEASNRPRSLPWSQYERFIGGTLAASFSSNVAICTALVPNVTS